MRGPRESATSRPIIERGTHLPIIGAIILFTLLFLFHNDPADNGMKPYGAAAVDQSQPSVAYSPAATKLRAKVFLQQTRPSWRTAGGLKALWPWAAE
jgi:hypothetical protein